MWLSPSAVERIRELEALLRDSVPLKVYEAAQVRIKELEKRVDWSADMLLRRGQSLPLSAKPEEQPKPKVEPRISEADRAKAMVVIEQGKALNLPETEITEAVQRTVSGWTEADIAAAIRAPSNGHG